MNAGRRADAGGAFQGHPAAVQIDQRFDQRQAQSGPPPGRDVFMVPALRERLEDAGKVAFGDADAGVGHGDGAFPGIVEGDGQVDAAAGPRELYGIGQQVEGRLIDRPPVGVDEQAGFKAADLKAQRVGGLPSLDDLKGCMDALADIEVAFRQFILAEVDLGQVEHVVDQGQQVIAAVIDVLDVFPVLGVIQRTEIAAQKNLGQPLDGIQGCAEFVAHVGEETAFGPFRFARAVALDVENMVLAA